MENDRKASKAVWPLVVMSSLLVFVTSKSHQNGKPAPQPPEGEEQRRHPEPVPLVTPDATATDPQNREPHLPAASRWQGPIEAGAIVVAIGLLILNSYQSRATQQAANAARTMAEATARQLEISQRPWISIDTYVVGPLTFNAAGAAQATLKFVVRNVGSSPAKGLSVQPEMYIASRDKQDPLLERSKVCETNRTLGTGGDGTLFPKGEFIKAVTFSGDSKDIVKESNRTGSFSPAVIVCASYRSTFDDRARYTTGIIYYLRQVDPNQPGIYFRLKNGVELPRESLVLTYDPIGAIAAD